MLTTAEPRAATSPAPPSRLRLRLQPDLSAGTLLDGGWWPRSTDPAAELPGLILAIEERHGPVTRVMLGPAGWDASRPRRLRVDGPAGSRVIRLGWFASMPAGLLTAIAGGGRTDLLTVPPRTRASAARAAMEQAAQAGNRARTPALLAAMDTGGRQAGATPDGIQLSTWEWEGGHDRARSLRAAASAPESPGRRWHRRLPAARRGRGPQGNARTRRQPASARRPTGPDNARHRRDRSRSGHRPIMGVLTRRAITFSVPRPCHGTAVNRALNGPGHLTQPEN